MGVHAELCEAFRSRWTSDAALSAIIPEGPYTGVVPTAGYPRALINQVDEGSVTWSSGRSGVETRTFLLQAWVDGYATADVLAAAIEARYDQTGGWAEIEGNPLMHCTRRAPLLIDVLDEQAVNEIDLWYVMAAYSLTYSRSL